MSTSRKPLGKLTILCAAMALSTGCATPNSPGYVDFESIGSSLGEIGRKTASATGSAWDGTRRFLGFGEPLPDEQELDEVDLALMEDDALLPGQDTTAEPAGIEIVAAPSQAPIDPVQPPAQTEGQLRQPLSIPENSQPEQPLADGSDGSSLGTPVAAAPLPHEVGPSETLWDIAKMATGDATNWHALAETNDLGPDAQVFPGQELIIPAELAKPEWVASLEATDVGDGAAGSEPALAAAEDLTDVPRATNAPVGQNEQASNDAPDVMASDNGSSDTAIETAAAEPEEPSTTGDTDASLAAQSEGVALEIGASETLWDFAKRTTGDATNWQAIADFNALDEKQATRVRPGQTILVPDMLLKPADDSAPGDVQVVATETQDAATGNPGEAPDTTSEVLAEETGAVGEQGVEPVLVAESLATEQQMNDAGTEQASIAQPVLPAADTATANDNATQDSQSEVMVSGTYYPKAVYNSADFYSSLLMRVSPGTRLTVSKAVGPWYEVQTDRGVGYMHARDVR